MVEPDNIVLQHLRAIREQLDTVSERQIELMQRMGAVIMQFANLSVQIDQIDGRLARVEQRLNLISIRVCTE